MFQKIAVAILIISWAGAIALIIALVSQHPPLKLTFESDIYVIQKAKRVCNKAGNTFVISSAVDGWKIGCKT